jgi:flagellar protein FlgJ
MQVQQVNSSPQIGSSPRADSSGANTKLKAECQQFEAVLWNQVLDAMQETVPQDGVMGDSFSNDVYQSMLNEQYSGILAGQDSSSNGLSGILYQQLSSQMGSGK